MPRDVIRAGGHDRSRSLGWLAIAWLEFFTVHGPGDVQGEPVELGDEYSGFVVDCYALDEDGRRLYDSVFLSRPKGCDKSGHAGRLALFEGLGPCRFAGWAKGGEVYRDPWGLGFEYEYAKGEPMGRPVTAPYIRCMATEEGQADNVYDTVYYNLTEGPLAEVEGVDPGLTNTYLPGGGEITPSTASSASKDGGKETFVAFDETHLYNTPELRRMYGTVTRNLRKRKKIAETWYLEATTMFASGEQSIAEATYKLAGDIREGRATRERLLFDHRYGECEDLADEEALRAAIVEAFGDAAAFNDVDGVVNGFYDPRNATEDSRRYFLNAPSSTINAWITEPVWAGCFDIDASVADGDVVVLGFDGSRRRAKGVTDATALIACRVADGRLFELQVWEQPLGAAGQDWEVPRALVDGKVRWAFDTYAVVGFYADPSKWETYIAEWERDFGARLQVKASHEHPIEWWMNRRIPAARAFDQFLSAVAEKELRHDGSYSLHQHVINARRVVTPSGVLIAKEHPESDRKIDAAVAATLAWQARLDAVAAGVDRAPAARKKTIRRW